MKFRLPFRLPLRLPANEPSTWTGLALLLAAFGVQVDAALLQHLAAGLTAAIGIWDFFRREK